MANIKKLDFIGSDSLSVLITIAIIIKEECKLQVCDINYQYVIGLPSNSVSSQRVDRTHSTRHIFQVNFGGVRRTTAVALYYSFTRVMNFRDDRRR
jgi:hypothetical protein